MKNIPDTTTRCPDGCNLTLSQFLAFDRGVAAGAADLKSEANPYRNYSLRAAWSRGHSTQRLQKALARARAGHNVAIVAADYDRATHIMHLLPELAPDGKKISEFCFVVDLKTVEVHICDSQQDKNYIAPEVGRVNIFFDRGIRSNTPEEKEQWNAAVGRSEFGHSLTSFTAPQPKTPSTQKVSRMLTHLRSSWLTFLHFLLEQGSRKPKKEK